MLLKITEKIIPRNVFEQKTNKSGLSANQAFQQLRPVEHLLYALCIYTPDALWPVSPQITSTWNEPYDITSLQNLFIMRHSLNTGFAVRNPYVQNMP